MVQVRQVSIHRIVHLGNCMQGAPRLGIELCVCLKHLCGSLPASSSKHKVYTILHDFVHPEKYRRPSCATCYTIFGKGQPKTKTVAWIVEYMCTCCFLPRHLLQIFTNVWRFTSLPQLLQAECTKLVSRSSNYNQKFSHVGKQILNIVSDKKTNM